MSGATLITCFSKRDQQILEPSYKALPIVSDASTCVRGRFHLSIEYEVGSSTGSRTSMTSSSFCSFSCKRITSESKHGKPRPREGRDASPAGTPPVLTKSLSLFPKSDIGEGSVEGGTLEGGGAPTTLSSSSCKSFDESWTLTLKRHGNVMKRNWQRCKVEVYARTYF